MTTKEPSTLVLYLIIYVFWDIQIYIKQSSVDLISFVVDVSWAFEQIPLDMLPHIAHYNNKYNQF